MPFEQRIDDEIAVRMTTPFDAHEHFELVERNRTHLNVFLRFPKRVLSVQDMERLTQGEIEAFARGEALGMGIWKNGVLVGNLAVRKFDKETGTAELAYFLDPAHEGRGIVSRCVGWLIGELFDVWKARKIEIWCDPLNTKSAKIAQRFGFTHEGTIRNVFANNGEVRDMMVWGLMKT